MDKWDELKLLIKADLSHAVHYSFERSAEHSQLNRVKRWMEYLEQKEAEENGQRGSDEIKGPSEEV